MNVLMAFAPAGAASVVEQIVSDLMDHEFEEGAEGHGDMGDGEVEAAEVRAAEVGHVVRPDAEPAPENLADRCSDLPVVAKPRFEFESLDGSSLGRLFHVGPRSVKAVCAKHKKCVCWLSLKEKTVADAELDLVKWLVDHAGGPDVHEERSKSLKHAYGMRLRG
jgi:hypothetical protein